MHYLFLLGFPAFTLAFPEPLSYKRNEAPPSNGTLYPGNCEWGLEGCYNEPPTGRILQYLTSDKSLTVEKCFQICSAFDYALVEFRTECWCGNVVNPTATPFTGEGTGCRLACAGDAGQLCGGQSKGLLYKRKPAGGCSTTSPTTTPTDTSTCVAATITVTDHVTVDNPITIPTTLIVTNAVTSDTTIYNTITLTNNVPTTVIETAAPSTVTQTTQVDNPITIIETAAPSTITQTTRVDKPVTVTEIAAPSTVTQTTQVDKPVTVTETAAPSTITQTAQIDKPVTVTETAAPSTVTQTTQVDKPLTVTVTSGPLTLTTTNVLPTTVIVTKNPSVSTTTTTIRTTISNCSPTTPTNTKNPNPTCMPSSAIQNPSWEQPGFWDYDSDGYNSISDNYSTTSSLAHSGTHVYRARMSKDGHWATASQYVTLCPSTKYTLKVWTKRPTQSSECVATFYVDGEMVIVSPDTSSTGWVAGTGNFYSGDGGKASVKVKVICEGNCGSGYNEMFVDDVAITPA
ncbi:unnamed protein product [Tuber aestivum]|uniref:WSC domain-containing protein n=1 Tax=Tuber aestivum TaxID=59557 RepID=A0A292PIM8_9PEZI|nr:unnamed protein product [Tuber aestivum]